MTLQYFFTLFFSGLIFFSPHQAGGAHPVKNGLHQAFETTKKLLIDKIGLHGLWVTLFTLSSPTTIKLTEVDEGKD